MNKLRNPSATGTNLSDPLISEEDAAGMLHMSKWTLARLRKEGKLPFVVILRKHFYRLSQIEGFVNKCSVPARAKRWPLG